MDIKGQRINQGSLNAVDWKQVHKKSRSKAFMARVGGSFLIIAIFLLIISGVLAIAGGKLVWVSSLPLILLALFIIPAVTNTGKDRLVIDGRLLNKHENIVRGGRNSSSYRERVFDLDVKKALLITINGKIHIPSDNYSEGVAIQVPHKLYKQYNELENITLVCLPNRRAIGILQDFM